MRLLLPGPQVLAKEVAIASSTEAVMSSSMDNAPDFDSCV
jgi:hypothetical protein